MSINLNSFSKLFSKTVNLILSSFLFTSISLGQGILRGVVLDSTNSEPLIGANIMVESTSLGTATDLEGKFKISYGMGKFFD